MTTSTLPKTGALVKISCGDVAYPHPDLNRTPEFLQGWADFFTGVVPDPVPSYQDSYDTEYTTGWKQARGHKDFVEAFEWTFKGTETREDGLYALLERQEVNSYDDVMNGSGTGMGHHTETGSVKLTATTKLVELCPVDTPEVGTLVKIKEDKDEVVWTFEGTEKGEDGCWYGNLSREDGTITKKAQIADPAN
jgi:hypothetical protein